MPVGALFGAGKLHPLLADDFASVTAWKLAQWIGLPDIGDWVWLVLGLWIVAVILAQRRIFSFTCPHCGKPFFTQKRSLIPYGWVRKDCIHCRLPKYDRIT
jgi:hypothetical protein